MFFRAGNYKTSAKNYKSSTGNFKIMLLTVSNKFQTIVSVILEKNHL